MIHYFPEHEDHLHEESPDCVCIPVFMMDEKSGEMVYMHIPLKNEHLWEKFTDIPMER